MSSRISHNTLEVFNPATGEDITSLTISSLSELDSILHIAKKAAGNYNFSSFYRRQKLMIQFRKGIVSRIDEFIETICSETGKKPAEGLMEVFISLDIQIIFLSLILFTLLYGFSAAGSHIDLQR